MRNDELISHARDRVDSTLVNAPTPQNKTFREWDEDAWLIDQLATALEFADHRIFELEAKVARLEKIEAAANRR